MPGGTYSVCGRLGRGHFRNLDVDLRTLSFEALNIHLELVAVKQAQPLMDVADANASAIDLCEALRRNAQTVVFNFDGEAAIAKMRAKMNLPAFEARGETMLDGIFDHWLQKHARNERFERVFVHFL